MVRGIGNALPMPFHFVLLFLMPLGVRQYDGRTNYRRNALGARRQDFLSTWAFDTHDSLRTHQQGSNTLLDISDVGKADSVAENS
jgi:hypothetical protein